MTTTNKGIINTGSIGGNATVEVNDHSIGDNVSIDAKNSTVALMAQMHGLRAASADDNAVAQAVAELAKLLESLRADVDELEAKGEPSAEVAAVKVQAERVVEEATAAKPNRSLLRISADGLKQAASLVAEVAPKLLDTAAKIVAVIHRLPI